MSLAGAALARPSPMAFWKAGLTIRFSPSCGPFGVGSVLPPLFCKEAWQNFLHVQARSPEPTAIQMS